MLPRAARRLETTYALSRQALPRPARLYSTPSRPTKAPALATEHQQIPAYPHFLNNNSRPSRSTPPTPNEDRILNDLERYLVRDRSFTVLPPPPPRAALTTGCESWVADSTTQESMSIMDACLHNLHDVPRAKVIFGHLRRNSTSSLLETGMYNAFIEAYFGMATQKDEKSEDMWLGSIHDLYHALESEAEGTLPNKMTYGLMLRFWLHYNCEREDELGRRKLRVQMPSPATLLEKMHQRKISPTLVVTETLFDTHAAATEAIKVLSQAALQLNIPDVIRELGQAEAIATSDDLQDIPEVMPVMREAKFDKEGNLVTEAVVPFTISQLQRHLTEVSQTRRVLPEDVMSRQKHLEKSAYDVALERLQQQYEKLEHLGVANPALNRSTLQKWMWEWHQKLQERLSKEIVAIGMKEAKSTRSARSETLTPYLTLVKAEKLSLITILEIMRLQGSSGLSDGMKTTRALVSVGKTVEMEYKAQLARKHPSKDITTQVSEEPEASASVEDVPGGTGTVRNFYSQVGYKTLQERRLAKAKHLRDNQEWSASWTQALRSKIGGILVDCLMEVAEVERWATCKKTGEKISEMQPAFHHAYEYVRGNKLGVIRLNPVVTERLAKDQLGDTLHPRHLPMLVKPQPWISDNIGGYLYSKTNVMRYKDSLEQQIYLREASKTGQFELVYAGLDVLGSTPWKINRKVFDVVLQVWNSGGRLGKIPPAVYDSPEPEKPPNSDTDMKAKSIYIARLKAWNLAKMNNHSDRCSVNYRMEIARAFLNDAFYFPHNLDFRGRAYPVPAHLNHMGDDLCRGLLTFAESKPLGERGLRWLKIHLANLYGYDKANFDERVKWVDENIDKIYETATNPLGEGEFSKWWLEAGDPWQFLSASIELRAALESGDAFAYESSLPVHQDGTCNGLQHYAALGGDVQGARQVNLAASDRPSDVYTHVGEMVERVIEMDAAKGDARAALLQGKITRKVVKQTVMTTVYGVTYVGAREQIEKQLKDRKDIPEEYCWSAAAYLAHVVLDCIGDLFGGAKSIQTWLNLCARLISKSMPAERIPELMDEAFGSTDNASKPKKRGPQPGSNNARMGRPGIASEKLRKEQMTSVIWTTPLGLPIVQPYRKSTKKQVQTAVQTVFISDPNTMAEVNTTKQASAFPPNFVHSLDATHMMLTALECRKKGLTFASVHDSYWTHASDIDEMSYIIRNTFIALHSSNVLGELRNEFMKRYQNYKIPLIALYGSGAGLGARLYSAGSRIYATPEQAVSLAPLKDLVVITDEKEDSTVDESRAVKDPHALQKLLDGLTPFNRSSGKSSETKASTNSEGYEESENEESDGRSQESGEESIGEESPQAKVARKRMEQQKELTIKLMGKFVNLTDLIPPLPKKGEFDVGTIKESLYFFS